MKIEKIHHVAYRCKDAKETVLWYQRMLNMDFILAFAEDHVPSTHEPDPYMHLFLDAGSGNVLAFFELPTKPEMGRDPNTPTWVQHIAFKVKDRTELQEFKEHLEKKAVEVLETEKIDAKILKVEVVEKEWENTTKKLLKPRFRNWIPRPHSQKSSLLSE